MLIINIYFFIVFHFKPKHVNNLNGINHRYSLHDCSHPPPNPEHET
jgi:hypothetical protein